MKNSYFYKHENILRCPICKSGLKVVEEKSLSCNRGHCFDIAKQGYVNFMQKTKDFYSQALFESRRSIFEKNFYDTIVLELNSLVQKYSKSGTILDVGCGEGFYLKSIASNSLLNKVGIDISKEAIKLAAKGGSSGLWLVADLENIPLSDQSVDVILNILTPANYKEFERVLKKDGHIIKIVAGSQYLAQLRELSKPYLKNETHENTMVIDHFKNNLKLLESKKILYSLPINKEDAMDFAKMTPMLTKVDSSKIDFNKLKEITIDLEVLVGRY